VTASDVSVAYHLGDTSRSAIDGLRSRCFLCAEDRSARPASARIPRITRVASEFVYTRGQLGRADRDGDVVGADDFVMAAGAFRWFADRRTGG